MIINLVFHYLDTQYVLFLHGRKAKREPLRVKVSCSHALAQFFPKQRGHTEEVLTVSCLHEKLSLESSKEIGNMHLPSNSFFSPYLYSGAANDARALPAPRALVLWFGGNYSILKYGSRKIIG